MKKRKIVLHTYLMNLVLPDKNVDALIDTTDSIWYCLDRYCAEHKLNAIRLLSLSKSNNISDRVLRKQYATNWIFIPNIWWWKIREILRILLDLEIIQINIISFGNLITAMGAKLTGAKVVYGFLNDFDFDQYPVPYWLLKFTLNNFVDLLFTPTEVYRKKLERSFTTRAVTVHYGIDPDHFKPKNDHIASDKQLKLMYIGRLTPDKNIDDLVQGLSLCKHKRQLHLELVGQKYDTPDAFIQGLINVMQENGISYDFSGYAPHSKLPDLLNETDIFVNMRKQEGFGKVFVEAMACGKPIIGRKGSAGPEEIIQHGINGFIVADPEELAGTLDRIFECREMLVQMGRNARTTAVNEYSYAEIYKKFNTAYSGIKL
jgi:glycosyltransferase involved in cell wall biosynthesis